MTVVLGPVCLKEKEPVSAGMAKIYCRHGTPWSGNVNTRISMKWWRHAAVQRNGKPGAEARRRRSCRHQVLDLFQDVTPSGSTASVSIRPRPVMRELLTRQEACRRCNSWITVTRLLMLPQPSTKRPVA